MGVGAGRECTSGCGYGQAHVKGNLGLHLDSAVRRAQVLEPHRAPSLASLVFLCLSVPFIMWGYSKCPPLGIVERVK